MHNFLANNRAELIRRCREKVLLRPRHDASKHQLEDGIPLFLDQLTRTLKAELVSATAASASISGATDGTSTALSEIGISAAVHGKALQELGYSVDQVVHEYGDLCQAITELAHDRDAPFEIDEFRTLNRCLDNAIAGAVTTFSLQRDIAINTQHCSEANDKLESLLLELREALQTSNLAIRAMEIGGLTLAGATGSVLKRSVASMRIVVDKSFAELLGE